MKGERKYDQDWLSVSFLSCSFVRDVPKATTILTCVSKFLCIQRVLHSKFRKFKNIQGSFPIIYTTADSIHSETMFTL